MLVLECDIDPVYSYVHCVRPTHARLPCRPVVYTHENFGLMRESVTEDPKRECHAQCVTLGRSAVLTVSSKKKYTQALGSSSNLLRKIYTFTFLLTHISHAFKEAMRAVPKISLYRSASFSVYRKYYTAENFQSYSNLIIQFYY